jgi:hypothetical protein
VPALVLAPQFKPVWQMGQILFKARAVAGLFKVGH